jgi:hypothetical protein
MSKALLLLLIAALASVSLGFNLVTSEPNDDRVKVDYYF